MPIGMQSFFVTAKSMPYLLYLCSMAAVRTCGGYSYFGICLVCFALFCATSMALRSSGAVLAMTSPPRFVTKAVATIAPFA